MTAPDPHAAFARLLPEQRDAVLKQVTPVSEERAAARAASRIGLAAPLWDSCYTWHNWIRGTNMFGATIFQFDHEITACYNGSSFTNNPATRSWASNLNLGWQYNGLTNETRDPSNGYGAYDFYYQSQGNMTNAITFQQQFPGLRSCINAAGSTTCWVQWIDK